MLTSGLFIMVFASTFAIFLTLAYANLDDAPRDRFLTLSTLGKNNAAAEYYPREGGFVMANETLDWNVQVYNHMGGSEYVAVRIKLVNATQQGPDDRLHLTTQVDHLYEARHLVPDGSTWTMPVSITLKELEIHGGNATINTIAINGEEITDLKISNEKERDFRFVIELWRRDLDSGNFIFTWPSGQESGSAWNQIQIRVR
jgi:uncharacterized protein YciU (UPF0263 family)